MIFQAEIQFVFFDIDDFTSKVKRMKNHFCEFSRTYISLLAINPNKILVF